MPLIVVNPGRPEENKLLTSLFLMQHRFGSNFRGAVGQFGVQRGIFVYRHAGRGRRMGQHRGGEYELFKVEVLKTFEKALAPLDSHRVIGRVILPVQIKESCQMNARGDAIAIGQSQSGQSFMPCPQIVLGEVALGTRSLANLPFRDIEYSTKPSKRGKSAYLGFAL